MPKDFSIFNTFNLKTTLTISITHVGKNDRADDRPKLAMLAVDIGPMINRGLDANCGPILACYIGPKIAPDVRPRIIARVKPMIFQIYNDINDDNKIIVIIVLLVHININIQLLQNKKKKKLICN